MESGSENGMLPGKTVSDIASSLYEWAEAIVFSLVVVILLFTFIFRTAGVIGDSMDSTLKDGDRVVLTSFRYTPKQGDIVVLTVKAVNEPIIKRVIAVGGQTVSINSQTNEVSVDGKVLSEPYINNPTTLPNSSVSTTFPLYVPKGYVFVMGDNREVSYDSRYKAIGLVDVRDIVGRAVFRLFPLSKFGLLN